MKVIKFTLFILLNLFRSLPFIVMCHSHYVWLARKEKRKSTHRSFATLAPRIVLLGRSVRFHWHGSAGFPVKGGRFVEESEIHRRLGVGKWDCRGSFTPDCAQKYFILHWRMQWTGPWFNRKKIRSKIHLTFPCCTTTVNVSTGEIASDEHK